MAKKRKAAAKKRVTRKLAATRRAGIRIATINTLVVLVVIVMVLGGLYLYAQNKKQAALLQSLSPAHLVAHHRRRSRRRWHLRLFPLRRQPERGAGTAIVTTPPQPAAGPDGTNQPVALIEKRAGLDAAAFAHTCAVPASAQSPASSSQSRSLGPFERHSSLVVFTLRNARRAGPDRRATRSRECGMNALWRDLQIELIRMPAGC